jgi:hypothetical protein
LKYIQKSSRRRVSTESLTFILGIAVGLLGILPDLENPFKAHGNAMFGGCAAFLAPVVIKRVLFESDDATDSLDLVSYVVEMVFVPCGIVLLIVGVGSVCIGIELYSGIAVCALGTCTFLLYLFTLFCKWLTSPDTKNSNSSSHNPQ